MVILGRKGGGAQRVRTWEMAFFTCPSNKGTELEGKRRRKPCSWFPIEGKRRELERLAGGGTRWFLTIGKGKKRP